MREHKLAISADQLAEIAENTVRDMNVKIAGKIAFDEFSAYIVKQPQLVSFLTVNISGMVQDVVKSTGMVFATPR